MNTSPVVADMIEVIEQHGKWREQEAVRLIASERSKKYIFPGKEDGIASPTPGETEAIIERTKWLRGEEKLRYWGLSYGTVIGATFATMQPHRVERAIIDGVADAADYYSGQ